MMPIAEVLKEEPVVEEAEVEAVKVMEENDRFHLVKEEEAAEAEVATVVVAAVVMAVAVAQALLQVHVINTTTDKAKMPKEKEDNFNISKMLQIKLGHFFCLHRPTVVFIETR